MLLRNGRQGLRVRQFLLTCALVTPLMFAIISAPPFSADTRAQGASRMFGPNFPAQVGSDSVGPTRSGNTITIPSRFSCGSSTNNVFSLSDFRGGKAHTVSRSIGGRQQTMTLGFTNGAPSEALLRETSGPVLLHSNDVTLRDFNRDGVFDGLTIGGEVSASTSFVFGPNNDSVSIPWAQASALGFKTSETCAGDVPQVWIPLADTNGDGRGDAVVLDLDGNGVADNDLFSGPMIAVPSVPSMGPIGRFSLMMLLGLIGAWFLSRRRHDSGSPASA
jgi:hypothetical protein